MRERQRTPTGRFARTPRARLAVAALALTAAAGACGGELALPPEPVASLTVTPDTLTLVVGDSRKLTATLLNRAGSPLTGRPVEWSSSDTALARVDGDGVVTGIAAGFVFVTATSEGLADTASVAVVGPGRLGHREAGVHHGDRRRIGPAHGQRAGRARFRRHARRARLVQLRYGDR
jgi:hypothetical protein